MASNERKAWLLLLVALLALLHPVQAHYKRLSKRSVSAADISNFRGAILVKNGKPTTCECALIDNKSALVAANCLDLNGKKLKDGSTYEIYFDGAKGNSPGKASIDSDNIIIHPKFNQNTYSNNLAILQFSYTAQSSWVNYIAAYRDEWTDIAYVRRVLGSASTNSWSTPKVRSYPQSDSKCEDASGLFRYNQDVFYCSRIYTASVFSSSCNMPYGSIYGVTSSSMAIAGLYSHSIVYGTGVCGGSVQYHYYIVLTNYLRWTQSVLGRKPKEFFEDEDGLKSTRRIISYYMKHGLSPNDDGTYMFGGDMISPRAGVAGPNPPSPPTTPPPTSAAPTTPKPSTTAPSNPDPNPQPNPPQPNPTQPNPPQPNPTQPSTPQPSTPQPNTSQPNTSRPSPSSHTTQGSQNTDDNDNNDNENGNENNNSNGNNNGSTSSGNTNNNTDDEDTDETANDDNKNDPDEDPSNNAELSDIDNHDEFLQPDGDSELASSSQSNKYNDPADTSGLYGDASIDNGLLDTTIPEVSNNEDIFIGLSRDAVIAMAVAIPAGTILLVIIAFILYKIYRKEKVTNWHSGNAKGYNNAHSLVDELGGASHGEVLPAYDDLHQAMSPRPLPA
ncbi:hypothetical protein IWW56_002882 [Coemansia sp. RSA 2131]|nr:hypothetical protein IWW56_002882 [Coemansia sp. RSA 2131]